MRSCPDCERSIDSRWDLCPNCGKVLPAAKAVAHPQAVAQLKSVNLWWLFPASIGLILVCGFFLLGFIAVHFLIGGEISNGPVHSWANFYAHVMAALFTVFFFVGVAGVTTGTLAIFRRPDKKCPSHERVVGNLVTVSVMLLVAQLILIVLVKSLASTSEG